MVFEVVGENLVVFGVMLFFILGFYVLMYVGVVFMFYGVICGDLVVGDFVVLKNILVFERIKNKNKKMSRIDCWLDLIN